MTTSGGGAQGELRSLPAMANYIIWYAKNRDELKYRQLYSDKAGSRSIQDAYSSVELADGTRRRMTKEERETGVLLAGARAFQATSLTSQAGNPWPNGQFPVVVDGREFKPGSTGVWKTSVTGMENLKKAGRLQSSGNSLRYVRYVDDFDAIALGNVWTDVIGAVPDKRYVVQTATKAIARCILMASDPGDLVLDPTCGSGTSAFVAEQYGRRWITVDTSRVALSIARERLLTARYDMYALLDETRGVDAGLKYRSIDRVTLRSIARQEPPETIAMYDDPVVLKGRIRVSGPFTIEALSRYAVNPADAEVSAPDPHADTGDHVQVLLDALKVQGIPRPGGKPYKIESVTPIAAAGAIQAEGVADLDGRQARFAVSLGPKFGAVTMGQVSDALRASIGFDLVVFGGFAVSAEAQERLGTGKVGGTDVALLLANPDLLVGDLLKNTKASQTFRLYAAPDVRVVPGGDGFRVSVEGVDSFDAATGDVTSFGRAGVQAWFLDDDYDGAVFRVSQAFFPVSDAWDKLQKALKGTVDAELLETLHGWESLPFDGGEHGRVAVRVIAQDGNAAEAILNLPGAAA